MHEECLIDAILTKVFEGVVEDGNEEADMNGAAQPDGKKGESAPKIWEGKFEGTLHTVNTAEGGHTTVTIKDLRTNFKGPKSWTERVPCLKCKSLLK
jgi:hypothetical protein